MREFFRGWKRKLGVVVLVMACVFAAVWVRSRIVSDSLSWRGTNTYYYLSTTTSSLVWQRTQTTPRTDLQKNIVKEIVTLEVEINGEIVVVEDEVIKNMKHTESVVHNTWATLAPSDDSAYNDESGLTWRWRWFGFGLAEFDQVNTEQELSIRLIYVPFWSIVIPLTLLSAYFLLGTPRVKTSPFPPKAGVSGIERGTNPQRFK